MKIIESDQASGALADYVADIQNGPVVFTNQGQPIAALVPIQNADIETITLGANRQFVELIERSRAQASREGGVSSADMRARFQSSTNADADPAT